MLMAELVFFVVRRVNGDRAACVRGGLSMDVQKSTKKDTRHSSDLKCLAFNTSPRISGVASAAVESFFRLVTKRLRHNLAPVPVNKSVQVNSA